MIITKENIDELTALLKVKIEPFDYEEQVKDSLKKYQKEVDLPGFRPGKVPVEIVRKRFGKHILAEELNTILSDSLQKYIAANNLFILGYPLPKENGHNDFDRPAGFEFEYEVGLAPKLNIKLSADDKVPYYTILSDEEQIEKHIKFLRRCYGKMMYPESSEEEDTLIGDFVEIDHQGNVVPSGFFRNDYIIPEKIKNEENRKKLLGLKTNNKVVFENLQQDAKHFFETLRIPAEKADAIRLQFRVSEIIRIIPAELNPELFDKIFLPGTVTDEETFRNKIKEDIAAMNASKSDQRFLHDVMHFLCDKIDVPLPDAFLKKYLVASSKEKISYEQAEKEYNSYSATMKWQLIENSILKNYNITVTKQEIENYFRNIISEGLTKGRLRPMSEENIQQAIKKTMEDEKKLEQALDNQFEQKLINLFKNTFTLDKKEVTYDEFLKIETHAH